MSDVSMKQYKMLKRMSRHKIISAENLTEYEIEICDYLADKGFAKYIPEYAPADNRYNLKATAGSYKITQDGEKQIYNFKKQFYKVKYAMIGSTISLIVSVYSAFFK